MTWILKFCDSENKHSDASKKMAERQNVDVEVQEVNGKQLSGKELLKQMGDDKKEATEPRSKDRSSLGNKWEFY